jgi:hypothetical protein
MGNLNSLYIAKNDRPYQYTWISMLRQLLQEFRGTSALMVSDCFWDSPGIYCYMDDFWIFIFSGFATVFRLALASTTTCIIQVPVR